MNERVGLVILDGLADEQGAQNQRGERDESQCDKNPARLRLRDEEMLKCGFVFVRSWIQCQRL